MGVDDPAGALERVLECWSEIADLERASGLLGWDQETHMPPKGARDRGLVQATLAGILHERLSSTELSDALGQAAESAQPGSVEAAHVREAQRAVDRIARIPARLAKELALARSAGHEAWIAARAAADFSLFEEQLEHLVRLKREEAGLLAGDGGRPFDALLDQFEPGMTEESLVPLFDRLRSELSPIVRAVADSGRVIDESPARGDFSEASQLAFGRAVAEKMGFDFKAGRLDLAPHPFCSGLAPGDVRITWRFHRDDFRPALYGIMHEAGHGLYEQGLPEDWQRTPLGAAVSLGMHESQSRLWENLVGRSRSFWEWAMPLFREHFPGSQTSVEELWPTLHTITPSLIRVEADQGTYDLHIAVRFEIERALFAGRLEVGELPEAWDALYEELLGVRAPTVADGVLQDIHWSFGGFGYFPTYTLGNLINAQLFETAQQELGDLDAQFARGEFAPLLGWLREKVHRHGSFHSADELVERATGQVLSPDAYLTQRRTMAEVVYGVSV